MRKTASLLKPLLSLSGFEIPIEDRSGDEIKKQNNILIAAKGKIPAELKIYFV